MAGGTAKQIVRYVALGALFLLPFTPLVVAGSLFFPFITGKALYLRVLIEVLFVAWVVLALIDRAYRPRFSWLGVIVLLFVIWMGLADALAPNAQKAFWSNFERMEGWMLLAHLAAFFFAASAVLRREQRWRAWFLTMLGASAVIVFYALLQLAGVLAIHQGSVRIDATLGNSAYLAVYLLFSFFIALWLAITEERTWLATLLYVLAGFHAILIFFTATRGTVAGLVVSVAFAAIVTLIYQRGRLRTLAAVVLLLLVVAGTGIRAARHTPFVQEREVLNRVATISLTQLSTRLTIWSMALAGAQERPLTGWGQEGFNYVFNTYYDPSLYRQELWFDRAHNAFLDWLSAGGVPAFVLYVLLFGVAVAVLWRRKNIPLPERVIFTALLLGYAIHNVFVFDNLSSYLYFFAVLALIDASTARPIAAFETLPVLPERQAIPYALPISAVALLILIYAVNVPSMRTAHGLVRALGPADTPEESLERFRNLLTRSGPGGQEIREQLVSFASVAATTEDAPPAFVEEATSLAASEMQKYVDAYPRDARLRLQLAYAYRLSGDLEGAAREIQQAIHLSPRKQHMWLEAGDMAWQMGDAQAAREAFVHAYELSPQFNELSQYAAAGYLAEGDTTSADRILVGAYGTTTLDSDVLAVAYYRTENWQRLLALWRLRASKPGATPQTWFSLAAVYYRMGNRSAAIETLKETARKFPDSAASVQAAIAQLEGRISP